MCAYFQWSTHSTSCTYMVCCLNGFKSKYWKLAISNEDVTLIQDVFGTETVCAYESMNELRKRRETERC